MEYREVDEPTGGERVAWIMVISALFASLPLG